MSLTSAELEEFLSDLVAQSDRWAHLVRHAGEARVYELIWDDECVNAWVICWSEDQDTGYHDHDESAAAVAVISGHVLEERMCLGSSTPRRVLGAGSRITISATAIHRVLHAGEGPAVTIHAYSPPLKRTGAYRLGPDGELQRESLPIEQELRAQAALT